MALKNDKRKMIIESAIKLFAKKGFHATSIQDIADDVHMSKGAFYNFFSSKEQLHLAIFEYYFDYMKSRMDEIEAEGLPPREEMMKQLYVPMEKLPEQKEFIIMYMREQSSSINKELRKLMEDSMREMYQWYKKILREIYGDEIDPFIGDLILSLESMRSGYLGVSIFQEMSIDEKHLPRFLMNRMDELVQAFMQGEKTIVDSQNFEYPIIRKDTDVPPAEQAASLLGDMKIQAENLELAADQKKSIIRVIDFLIAELDKPQFEALLFQGMLANLKDVPEFDIQREKIAQLLNLKLL